jgi:hypothetical protein
VQPYCHFCEVFNIISSLLCPFTLNLFLYYFSSSSAPRSKLPGFISDQCQSIYSEWLPLSESYVSVLCAVLVTRSFNVVKKIPATLLEWKGKWSEIAGVFQVKREFLSFETSTLTIKERYGVINVWCCFFSIRRMKGLYLGMYKYAK